VWEGFRSRDWEGTGLRRMRRMRRPKVGLGCLLEKCFVVQLRVELRSWNNRRYVKGESFNDLGFLTDFTNQHVDSA